MKDDAMQFLEPVKIRYGTTDDAAILSAFAAKAFYDTFAEDNTPENIEAYLIASFSPEIQFQELSASDNVFLMAEIESKLVGYAQLMLESQEASLQGTRSLEIRRIYASQEYLGHGAGKELMRASLQEARQRGCDSIWLGVWEKNPRAIRFYQKWGFKEVGTHIFNVGDDPQRDFIMELALAWPAN
jgi:ribosomal protein S18 acetylase RimI-like enzyme